MVTACRTACLSGSGRTVSRILVVLARANESRRRYSQQPCNPYPNYTRSKRNILTLRGEVWRNSQADASGFLPLRGKDGRHLGFLDWYEKWLDAAIDSEQRPDC